jgi:large conductance mechanosensitive channel
MAGEFRELILRGNVVDLAVGIVIGAAFGAVVTALVTDIITPIVSIPGKTDFSSWTFSINSSVFRIGAFINAVISFILIAAAVFFFVVKPVNALMALRKTETPAGPTTRDCPYCLSKVPLAATRCAYCTADIAQDSARTAVPAETVS